MVPSPTGVSMLWRPRKGGASIPALVDGVGNTDPMISWGYEFISHAERLLTERCDVPSQKVTEL